MTLKDHPALLLIDLQKGMANTAYWGGSRNNPEAEQNAARLLHCWRAHGLPVFHIKHNSTNPESPLAKGRTGNDIMDMVKPIGNEPVIEKNVNSAFIGTDLQQRLDQEGIKKVVIAGLVTDHCVSATARMAANLGYDTSLIGDACATFDRIGPGGKKFSAQMVHEVELASLLGEFATILTTGEWLSNRNESKV